MVSGIEADLTLILNIGILHITEGDTEKYLSIMVVILVFLSLGSCAVKYSVRSWRVLV